MSLYSKFEKSGKTIGFTASCFDLLHAGHYLMLEDAKKQCDVLIVALQSDPTLDLGYRMKTGGKQKKYTYSNSRRERNTIIRLQIC